MLHLVAPIVDPQSVALLGVGALMMALAAVVYLARPRHAPNRWLALFLFAGGLWTGPTSVAARLLDERPEAAHAAVVTYIAAAIVARYGYAMFLSTLPTPWVAPLRGTGGRVAVTALFALLLAWLVLVPQAWTGGVVPLEGPQGTYYETRSSIDPDPSQVRLWWGAGMGLLHVAAVAVAFDAYRRARAPLARRQLRLYLASFATYDLLVAAWMAGILLDVRTLAPRFPAIEWLTLAPGVAGLVLVGGTAYAILAAQLFDIELKLKWTLRRGTLAAAFVAAFFFVSELASALLSERMGVLAGVAATAALVFALAPLQRLADRVADTAMPHVRDTPEYRGGRAREIYRAAVESALQDGVVTDRERDVLATLADELGLTAREALELERSVAPA